MEPNNQNFEDINSLETPSTVVQPDSSSSGLNQTANTGALNEFTSDSSPIQPPQSNNHSPKNSVINKLKRIVNIYLILFIIMLITGAGVIYYAVLQSRNEGQIGLNTQSLTQDAIDQIQGSDAKIGDPKYILNVESNAVFSGQVLIRDSLDVAGTIRVGGPLSLPGITVAGTSSFDEVQINNLNISGDTGIQGNLSVQGTMTVKGAATFGGVVSAPQLNVTSLQLNGDIRLNRHIDAGGGTPKISTGSAAGGGGTASVSGTDTAGTVTINTGNAPSTGTLANISFANAFNDTPHVVISPVSASGAGISYYATRTSTGFTIATASSPPAGSNLIFDFIAID